ncbi:MAG TPA: glycerophosphodiester phosphodiesterase [Oribacterium sp.]|nr:glycerophosphodiester phosphodiesterase [Oribacterium sp.]
MNRTEVFAHRGASGYAPENTLEAFQLAIKQGADGIELDVQLSKDGVPVVIHDETVDRVTGQTGFVKDFTIQELKDMVVLGERFTAYPDARIPTLREVLDAVRPSGIEVNIELKTGIIWYPEIEKKVAAIVEETGMKDRVIYSSFNHYSVQKIKETVPEAETAYLFSDVILHVDQYAKESGVDGLHPAVYHVKMADFLREYLASGLKTRVWTVNERADMKALMEAGVTAVITNYPDVAVQLRSSCERGI